MSQTFAGRQAFVTFGVGARNPHDRRSAEHLEFKIGLQQAQFAACEAAQREALAYHALSVRDNAIDRAWAAKLDARASHGHV